MFSYKVFIFINFLNFIEAYKILVYNPKYATSHVTFMGRIADVLAKAGHDVLVYEQIVYENIHTNGTELARVLIRAKDFETSASNLTMQEERWSGKKQSLWAMIKSSRFMREDFAKCCRHQIQDKELVARLKSENFDIGIGEPFDACFYGIMEKIGLNNYITALSTALMEHLASLLGIPATPSFLPGLVSKMLPPFSYFERTQNLAYFAFVNTLGPSLMSSLTGEVLKEELGSFDVAKKVSDSTYFFVNVDEFVDFPRPISHKIINIGGIGQVQSKPLPKKYEDLFKNAKKGVILVSFGSMSLSYMMPQELKQLLLDTFSRFPDVTFLWKYEKDEDRISEGYPNVVTEKWVPQNDLLEHPKLLAFVTHAGMNSVQESAAKGVPLICIPLFADQMRNAKTLEYRKVAIVLDRNELTAEILSDAIRRIIENDSYRKNAKRISSMIANKPMASEERIVKYTEFAAEFGPDLNLELEGRNLNFIQFYCLDIIIPAILAVLSVIYLIYRLVFFVVRKALLFGSKQKVE